MSAENVEHRVKDKHFEWIGSGRYQDWYAFIPKEFTDQGAWVLSSSEPTAYVEYLTPQGVALEESEFARENPGRGKMTAVANNEVIYEKVINEKLPFKGPRILYSHQRATEKVCAALGLDPKPHHKQRKDSLLKHWGTK